jgi:DNA-binding transcriptional regulator YiaG
MATEKDKIFSGLGARFAQRVDGQGASGKENAPGFVTSEKEQTKRTPSDVGRRIGQIISDLKMTKKAFAESLGVTPDYIYKLTSGRFSTVSPLFARSIETMHGYPPGFVLGLGESKEALRLGTMDDLRGMNAEQLKAVQAFIRSMDKDSGRK